MLILSWNWLKKEEFSGAIDCGFRMIHAEHQLWNITFCTILKWVGRGRQTIGWEFHSSHYMDFGVIIPLYVISGRIYLTIFLHYILIVKVWKKNLILIPSLLQQWKLLAYLLRCPLSKLYCRTCIKHLQINRIIHHFTTFGTENSILFIFQKVDHFHDPLVLRTNSF